eukprot:scaffold3806_cov169-Amphora_coffeaeformis.AAC.2
MGCGPSKLDGAEDSIHVMLSSEKRKKLEEKGKSTQQQFVPRKDHPKLNEATETDEAENLDKLIYHAANHNDTVDSRDLDEYGNEKDEA